MTVRSSFSAGPLKGKLKNEFVKSIVGRSTRVNYGVDCARCSILVTDVQLSTTTSKPTTVKISYGEGGYCNIEESTIISPVKFTEKCKIMYLDSISIPNPSQDLLDKLADGVKSLIVTKYVGPFYLPKNLIDFELFGKGKVQLIIDKKSTHKLQKLYLDNLPQLPTNIGSLRSLKFLECYKMQEANLDFSVFTKMLQLAELVIIKSGNVTTSKPSQLPSLRSLEISDSIFNTSNAPSCKFPMLERLLLENASFGVIPDYFRSMTKLKFFRVVENQLRRVLLDDFGNFKQLEQLDLSRNLISELITKKAIHLPRLQTLDVSNNKLSELNVKLWIMPALENLELADNQLKQVTGLVPLLTRKAPALNMFLNPWNCTWMNETLLQFSGLPVFIERSSPCLPFSKLTWF